MKLPNSNQRTTFDWRLQRTGSGSRGAMGRVNNGSVEGLTRKWMLLVRNRGLTETGRRPRSGRQRSVCCRDDGTPRLPTDQPTYDGPTCSMCVGPRCFTLSHFPHGGQYVIPCVTPWIRGCKLDFPVYNPIVVRKRIHIPTQIVKTN